MMGGISRDAAEGSVEDCGSDSLMLSFRDDAIKIDCFERKQVFDFGTYILLLFTSGIWFLLSVVVCEGLSLAGACSNLSISSTLKPLE